MWHWGKEGAGAKFTMALGSALSALKDRQLLMSAADKSDLALDLQRDGSFPFSPVSIFRAINRNYLVKYRLRLRF